MKPEISKFSISFEKTVLNFEVEHLGAKRLFEALSVISANSTASQIKQAVITGFNQCDVLRVQDEPAPKTFKTSRKGVPEYQEDV
jgi:hypothetical protein